MSQERINIVLHSIWLIGVTSGFLIDNGIRRVHTKYGYVEGHVETIDINGKYSPVVRFLGIPYAAPPVGDLRMKKPVPISRFNSSRVGHSYGPSCIQDERLQPDKVYSEDCLYLNIYSPISADRPGLVVPKPVLVWIHGGGFIFGDSTLYPGDVLSSYTDVIVVAFNYRLGPLGFFSLHDDYARGNYGMWDQHMAIQWVKDNIADFGGDSNSITIFGESAGGASVVFQMMYPGNKGLFQRAIAESGSMSPWALTTKDLNYNSSLAFAYALGCNNTSHAELMLCISIKDSSAVKAAAKTVLHITEDFVRPAWVPVYDGYFVISDPSNILDKAADANTSHRFSPFQDIDLLVGANNYDGAVYLPSLFNITNIYQTLTEQDFAMKAIPILLELVSKKVPSTAEVHAVIREYENTSDHTSLVQSLIHAITDVVFNVPAVKTSRAHATMKQSNTYLYQFSTSPPYRLLQLPPYLTNDPMAANHADELVYVFGYATSIGQALFNTSYPISDNDTKMSKFMMTMWSNFARTGNPNTPTNLHQFYDVSWPQFTLSDARYIDITPSVTQTSVKRDLAGRAVAFWDSV